MSRYRVFFSATIDGEETGPNCLDFVEAPDKAHAVATVARRYGPTCSVISCTVEGEPVPPSPVEQRDGLIRAIRPLYTVCRALLDNPTAPDLFTTQMRAGLEELCADAVAAMKAAGVTR